MKKKARMVRSLRHPRMKGAIYQSRVVDMEPWAYRRSVVLLAEVLDDGRPHTLLLKFGTFQVELHGLPGLCMIVAIAKAIEAKLGDVLCVYNRDGDDCVGRFIRIWVRFDVELPLICRIPVTFSEVEVRVVDFNYEYLSKNCFACGSILLEFVFVWV
ncbi:PREDICTED: reverse mRNAase [Prunus dulcis]|uniref:PREDICTED: reverse mRNAase n=1 Tax=Prunus dulcis TaxID=3755 RepID=A0A5E4FR66_PRUDU|nr:PREDICTED: reverse mRNAase [Prunus dulcis]